jgi:type I restriction enzyme, S subunit
MHEWREDPLGALATIRRGISYTEETLVQNAEDGSPYVNMKSFRKGGGYNRNGLKYFSGHYGKSDTVSNRDLLIANTDVTPGGDIIGAPAYLPAELQDRDVVFSHHVTRLSVGERVSPKFLYFLLCSGGSRTSMFKYARGTTVLMLDIDGIKRIPIRYPLTREVQERISSVLLGIDAAIEKTEALIAKYQHIKAGLMHDLFTRGVLPNCQLRPPREQAPELYRETAIGWIPADWTVSVLRACLTDSPTNGMYLPPAQIGEGTLLIGQTAFTLVRSIDFSLCRRGRVGSADLERYGIEREDILVTRVFATVQGVGLPTLVPDLPEDAVFESNMMRLRIDRTVIKAQLLFEWLRTSSLRRRIESGVNASNQASVNQKALNSLPVVLPNANEQDRILAKIKSIDNVHRTECAALSKLQSQKIGLMQDLLTGKVQVALRDNQIAASHA